jgi:hypothetical protein
MVLFLLSLRLALALNSMGRADLPAERFNSQSSFGGYAFLFKYKYKGKNFWQRQWGSCNEGHKRL